MALLPIVIGIDVGTSGVRAMAVDSHGSLIADANAPLCSVRESTQGIHQQDPAEWWLRTCRVSNEISGCLGPRIEQLAGMAVTSTSGTLVLVDDVGNPLRPAIMYDDARASQAVHELHSAAADGKEQWNHSYTLAKAVWVRKAEPAIWERVRWILHPADWIAGMLIGTFGMSDPSNCLKLGYRPEHRDWSPTVERVGIPGNSLPVVHNSGTPIGVLSRRAANALGFAANTPILAGATDGIASLIASGARNPGDGNTTLGTTVVWKVLTVEKPVDSRGIYSHLHPSGLWAPGAASSSGPGALMKEPGRTLAELDSAAAARLPAEVLCYVLAGTGERFPFLNPRATSFVEGQPETEADWWASQLQAIAFLERWGYEVLTAGGAEVGHHIYSAGGAARSDTLSQLRADVLQREIVNCRHPAAAFGAAILAASGAIFGCDCSAAIQAMAKIADVREPQSAKYTGYDELYRQFRIACRDRGYS